MASPKQVEQTPTLSGFSMLSSGGVPHRRGILGDLPPPTRGHPLPIHDRTTEIARCFRNETSPVLIVVSAQDSIGHLPVAP
jgi:hypothetical protein